MIVQRTFQMLLFQQSFFLIFQTAYLAWNFCYYMYGWILCYNLEFLRLQDKAKKELRGLWSFQKKGRVLGGALGFDTLDTSYGETRWNQRSLRFSFSRIIKNRTMAFPRSGFISIWLRIKRLSNPVWPLSGILKQRAKRVPFASTEKIWSSLAWS